MYLLFIKYLFYFLISTGVLKHFIYSITKYNYFLLILIFINTVKVQNET